MLRARHAAAFVFTVCTTRPSRNKIKQHQTFTIYNVSVAPVDLHINIFSVFVQVEPSSLADGQRSFLQAGLLSTASSIFMRSLADVDAPGCNRCYNMLQWGVRTQPNSALRCHQGLVSRPGARASVGIDGMTTSLTTSTLRSPNRSPYPVLLGLPHGTSHIDTVQRFLQFLDFRPRVPVRSFAGSGLAPKTKVFVTAKRLDIFIHFCFCLASWLHLVSLQRR